MKLRDRFVRSDGELLTKVHRYSNFSGGENLLMPPSLLSQNEVAWAENFEFTPRGGLQIRPGIVPLGDPWSAAVSAVYAPMSKNCLLVVSGGTVFYCSVDLKTRTSLGSLPGSDTPSFCEWGEGSSAVVLACAGAGLISIPLSGGGSVSAISVNAEGGVVSNCAQVFSYYGRAAVVEKGTSRVAFSSIGDASSWAYNMYSVAGGQGIDVGYKDGGYVTAVIPVNKDLLVFKTAGVYLLSGSPPMFSVMEITRSVKLANKDSLSVVNGNVYYVDPTGGVSGFLASESQGEFVASPVGSKVNKRFLLDLDIGSPKCSVVFAKKRNEIWFFPDKERTVWVYNLYINAWTHFSFAPDGMIQGLDNDCQFHCAYPSLPTGEVYLSFSVGGKHQVYTMSDDKNLDGRGYYRAKIVFPTVDLDYEVLVTRVEAVIRSTADASAVMTIQGEDSGEAFVRFPVSVTMAENGEVIEDLDEAFSDSGLLAVTEEVSRYCLNVFRARAVSPTLFVSSGRLAVKEIKLWIAEV